MWSRIYCCCAVPLYNSGIYLIIAQFFVVSIVTGILSLAAPKIVAVAIPSWGPYLFGGVCLLVSAVQIVGFFGVYREKPALFNLYARFNALATSIALAIALAFIGLSAGRHATALTACEATFSSQSSSGVSSGSTICNIWTWVQVGIMGLLFVIIALCEAYFMIYQSIYSSEQKLDHARYESVVETAAEEIRQSGLWDGQADHPGLHNRNESMQSSGLRNEIRADGEQEEYLDDGYGRPVASGSDPYAHQPYGEEPYYPDQSRVAYAQPTPIQGAGYGGYEDEKDGYPQQARVEHPLDGGSRHKMPRQEQGQWGGPSYP